MIRYNYYQTQFERWFGHAGWSAPDAATQRSAAAAAVALALLVALWIGEAQRIAALDAQIARVRERAAAAATEAERVARLQHAVTTLRDRRRTLDEERLGGLDQSNQIARVGNRLPDGTWLDTLRTDASGSWTLNGRASRLAAIGSALRTLADLDSHGDPRLLSLTADARREHLLDFTIAWDRAR